MIYPVSCGEKILYPATPGSLAVRQKKKQFRWTHRAVLMSNYGCRTRQCYLGVWAMRHVLFLLGLVFLFTCASYAQSSAANPLLLAAPFTISSTGDVSAVSASPSSATLSLSPASVAPSPGDSFAANPFSTAPVSSASAPNAAPDPQYVQGVFVNYNWRAYIGYTFTHFSAQGGISRNQNGFNWGITYYLNSWFGVEGEMFATHDSPNNESSWFLFGGGGPRFRWEARRGIEVFAHALVGYSHLTPQTAFGTQEAFGYELGGGADFPTPWRRIDLRAGADMIGTRYFSNNQFNPKVYGGVVFKF